MDNKGPKKSDGPTGTVGSVGSGKDSITPDFLKKDGKKAGGGGFAANALRAAEDAAGEGGEGGEGDGFSAAKLAENALQNSAASLFTGKGKQKSSDDKKEGFSVFKNFMKNNGPMSAIIGIICAFGGLMGGSQSLMPMALEEMIVQKLNTIGISSTAASDAWLNAQLNYGVKLKNVTTGKVENNFAFSEHQVEAFEKNGIKVFNATDNTNGVGGTSITRIMTLLYRKGFSWTPVVGSDMLAYNGYTETDLMNAIRGISGISNLNPPVSASTALADPDFKTPYTKASKTWRGGISGWFDKTMSNVTETKLNIKRNRWARAAADTLKDWNKKFDDVAKAAKQMQDQGVDAERTVVKDSNGNEVEIDDPDDLKNIDESLISSEQIDKVEIDDSDATPEELAEFNNAGGQKTVDVSDTSVSTLDKLSNVLNSKALKVASTASEVSCALLEGVLTIYSTVSAYQAMAFLNTITGYLEAIDRVKAGDGGPINNVSNNLTTPSDTVSASTGEVTATKKSAMMSAGMSWLFGIGNVNSNDPSVQNVNFESIMNRLSKITSSVKLTSDVYAKCGYLKAGFAAIDLISTIVSFIPIIGQGIKAVQISIKAIVKVAVKVAVQIAFYIIVPIAVKMIAKTLMKDAATEWFGEDLGNAIVSGADQYLGGNSSSGGAGPGSAAKVSEYLELRDTVIAEEAEYQRSIKSPFDISSPYTFLGSLFYSVIPLAYSSSGVMSALSNMSTTVSNSVVAMLPSASALGIHTQFASSGDCKLLESTGAIGDALCNPIMVTDTSTLYESPVAIYEKVRDMKSDETDIATNGKLAYRNINESENFDDEGNVRKDSDLAAFITFCGTRTSRYGLRDSSIVSRLNGDDKLIVKLAGNPITGSIKDIVQGLIESNPTNLDWFSGTACVANDESKTWQHNKYYARYMESERLAENMDPNYKSPVTAYLEEQFKDNPMDNSFEGTLARFSGQTKEQVEDSIALIQYYMFVDEYNPVERYAFGQDEKPSRELKFDNDNKVAYGILSNDIVFADVRNRNFVV